MKKDECRFDSIKEMFDGEKIEVPESLSKWNMIKEISSHNIKPKKDKTVYLKRIMSFAASLVIVLIASYVAVLCIGGRKDVLIITEKVAATDLDDIIINQETNEQETQQNLDSEQVTENSGEQVSEISDKEHQKIKDHFKRLYAQMGESGFNNYYDCVDLHSYGMAADSSADIGEPSANNTAYSATGGIAKNYSRTNTQYENVDEGDIIKNDDRYIYVVRNSVDNEQRGFNIIDTQTMEVVADEIVDCKDNYYLKIMQLYVNGDTLVAVCSENSGFYINNKSKPDVTVIAVYDIKDRGNPELRKTIVQDGSFSSSRMIGSVLYILTDYTVRGESEEEVVENCIPTVNGEYADCDCIYIEDENTASYVVFTALDTLPEGKSETICVLGGGNGVYCSENNFYALDIKDQQTQITAFSLNGTSIKYKATGIIEGQASQQYFYDEYKGFLRVATTFYDSEKDKSVSSLHILNSELKEVSCLEDIANDERVESARFMGDVGYVVTFKETDPLFTFDLSDPYNPKIMGELKLPGFSTYLHPLSDGLLLGFGYDGDMTDADYSSVKISLFDISDLKNPKELDSFVMKNADTELHYDAKALIYNETEKTVSIPITKVGPEYYNGNPRMFVTLKIFDGKIEMTNEYNHDRGVDYSQIFRAVCIADNFYTVCDSYVIEYDVETSKKTRICDLLSEQKQQCLKLKNFLQ